MESTWSSTRLGFPIKGREGEGEGEDGDNSLNASSVFIEDKDRDKDRDEDGGEKDGVRRVIGCKDWDERDEEAFLNWWRS